MQNKTDEAQQMLHTNIKSKQIAVYFDFDGTLTSRDTLLPFLIYTVGYTRFFLKFHILIPILLGYWLKVFTNERAKEKTLMVLLNGYSLTKLQDKAKNFALRKLDRYIKPEIYTKLEYHVEHGHSIFLVSANLALYLEYWAQRHHIDGVIATEVQFINGVCTGKLQTRNCYGKHKLNRINEYLKKHQVQFDYSYGYGNSRGDYELLFYVNEGYWISGTEIVPWVEYRGSRSDKR